MVSLQGNQTARGDRRGSGAARGWSHGWVRLLPDEGSGLGAQPETGSRLQSELRLPALLTVSSLSEPTQSHCICLCLIFQHSHGRMLSCVLILLWHLLSRFSALDHLSSFPSFRLDMSPETSRPKS